MVFFFSQMKRLQLPTEVLAEGIGGRACKGPDHTNSTLGVPSLVCQLSLPPQPRVGGSHPDNMLHPTPGLQLLTVTPSPAETCKPLDQVHWRSLSLPVGLGLCPILYHNPVSSLFHSPNSLSPV